MVRFLVWWSFRWSQANEEKSVGQGRTYAERQGWGLARLREVLFAGWLLGLARTRWQTKTLKSLALHYDGLHLLQLLLLHQEAILQIHLDGIHAAVLHNDKPHAENTAWLTWSNAIPCRSHSHILSPTSASCPRASGAGAAPCVSWQTAPVAASALWTAALDGVNSCHPHTVYSLSGECQSVITMVMSIGRQASRINANLMLSFTFSSWTFSFFSRHSISALLLWMTVSFSASLLFCSLIVFSLEMRSQSSCCSLDRTVSAWRR